MKYKFYTKSEKAWVAMLQDIKEAKHSIYLESFILTDDSSTHNFFEALKEKARRGVCCIFPDRKSIFVDH